MRLSVSLSRLKNSFMFSHFSPAAFLSRGGKNRFRFPRLASHPPWPPLCKGGKGIGRPRPSFDRAQQKHASRNRPSNSSQPQLFTGPVRGWADEKLVLHKLHFHPDFVAPFSPPCEGGVGGVVPAWPVTRSSHALSLSVLSHPSREARRTVFDFQGFRLTPPGPPFARGGKGSVARVVVRSRATKTRVSKSSLQLSQPQLFTGPVRGWADEKLVLHKLHFHPDFVAPFSPPCEGGVGGVVPAWPVTRSSHALSLSVLSHPSREARRTVFDFQGSRPTPPGPPFARGGKGSVARAVVRSRATKTRVSKPSLQWSGDPQQTQN